MSNTPNATDTVAEWVAYKLTKHANKTPHNTVYGRICKLAKQRGCSPQAIIADALTEYLERHG